MKTKIIKIDPYNIDMDKISYAADILKTGGLVAFPTETVYGLGASALDEAAVKSIFNAKGRPSDNPLIVHVADKTEAAKLTADMPPIAHCLMDAFWPGPLTLVMAKSDVVPGIITAGLDTVAVRMPSHPVALSLIMESGIPVAAPSANTSGKPSPTNAQHVIEDMSGKVDVIIDAGNANVGLESTVLDLTVDPPMILRPGGVTPRQLMKVIGKVDVDPALQNRENVSLKPRSPGVKYTHYSPKAQVIVVEGGLDRVVAEINILVKAYKQKGLRVGVLATEQTKTCFAGAEVISAGSRAKPETIASNLFNTLREFDKRGVDLILAEAVESSGIGLAVMNRLNKAAGYNIIKV